MIVVDGAGDAWRMFPPDMLRSQIGWPAWSDPDDLDLDATEVPMGTRRMTRRQRWRVRRIMRACGGASVLRQIARIGHAR